MTQEKFIIFYDSYKRGSYTKLVKEKQSGDYKKITAMVIRFVNYYNIKSIKEKATAEGKKREYEIQIIPHVLKLNTNTNNLLLCAYTTNKHKAHTKYYFKDNEISSDEYYLKNGDKKQDYKPTVLYNFKLNDVISIGNY